LPPREYVFAQAACRHTLVLYSPHSNFQHFNMPFFADGRVEKPCCRVVTAAFFRLALDKKRPACRQAGTPKC